MMKTRKWDQENIADQSGRVTNVTGGDFYGPSGLAEMRGYPKKAAASRLSQDPQIAERLWEMSERLTGIDYLQKLPQAA